MAASESRTQATRNMIEGLLFEVIQAMPDFPWNVMLDKIVESVLFLSDEDTAVPKETEGKERPKLVYIAHRMGGDILGNTNRVLEICKQVLSPDCFPFAPYLIAFQYLDDSRPEQRRMGMNMNTFFFEQHIIDEILLCGPSLSPGMIEEIKLGIRHNIPIRCQNPALQPAFEEVLAQLKQTE